ncbi:MAG TPA: nucleoside phosphorylase [Candidatus Limnocylindrales bacterium]|nr:nucleoside phosphorylase [Candidatus Limnocylindrales bacterium]
MNRTLYLKCAPGDLAERVLLTGDPARVERIAGAMDEAREVAHSREFLTVTGSMHGIPISVVSSGIGAPSAAIALEEMAQAGAKAVVRVGTTMGINLPMGALVLAAGAVRLEGTSSQYLPLAYPAVPAWPLAKVLETAALATQSQVAVGVVATVDAFYPKMASALVGRGFPDLDEFRRAGVIALDMETSLVLSLGRVLGLATASLCLVTNSADPFGVIDSDARDLGEQALIRAVFDGLIAWEPDRG